MDKKKKQNHSPPSRSRDSQVKKCADAGAEMVRITVQGMQEAKACAEIKKRLVEDGYETPLIADIHFAPKVAMMVAECFDKIRVNPGNFADGRKKFEDILYETDEEYNAEIEEIEKIFTPLVLKCKERGVAMRIGTNHGSLSARTLSRYGDTPAGMVESAFEFARICRKHDYHNFVFSMKASNPLVMVQAYRLLAHEMYKLGWDYPLHLGVTEAGEGEDGRMKSSIGIGALLLDGLGDTIRVSLTEASHLEMEPCTRLRDVGHKAAEEKWGVEKFEEKGRDFKDFARRASDLPVQKEDDAIDLRNILHRDGSVLSAVTPAQLASEDPFYRDLGAKLAVGMPLRDIATSDSILLTEVPAPSDEKAMRSIRRLQEIGVGVVADAAQLAERPVDNAVALVAAKAATSAAVPDCAARVAVVFDGTETTEEVKAALGVDPVMALIRVAPGVSRLHASRRLFTEHPRRRVIRAGDSPHPVHRRRRQGRRRHPVGLPGWRPALRRPRRRRPHRAPHRGARLPPPHLLRPPPGLAHAQHQDGVRLVPVLRPHALRPAGGDRRHLRAHRAPPRRGHRGHGLHRERSGRDGRRGFRLRRRRARQD